MDLIVFCAKSNYASTGSVFFGNGAYVLLVQYYEAGYMFFLGKVILQALLIIKQTYIVYEFDNKKLGGSLFKKQSTWFK
jgi:hypothetical protein